MTSLDCTCTIVRGRVVEVCEIHRRLVDEALDRQLKQLSAVKRRLAPKLSDADLVSFWVNAMHLGNPIYDECGRPVGIVTSVVRSVNAGSIQMTISFSGVSV